MVQLNFHRLNLDAIFSFVSTVKLIVAPNENDNTTRKIFLKKIYDEEEEDISIYVYKKN